MNNLLFLLSFYVFVFNIEPIHALKLKPHLSREELGEYIRTKIQKYRHLSGYEELSPENRSLLRSIDPLMAINVIRCDRARITDEKLRDVLAMSFKYINETLSPARKEWKKNVKLIMHHSLPLSSFKGDTLIVGCVHSEEKFKDGSDHHHEGIYTINKNSLDGFAPDLKVDITKTYFIKRVFPQGEQFQTIYLEYITVSPLSSANTFKNILHLLKPGGRLIFDHYSSYGYTETTPSSIVDRFSVIIGSTKLFEIQFDIPDTDLAAYKKALAKVGAQLMVINGNTYLHLNKKSFKAKRKLIEPCMIILMKKYIESMGFVNISLKTVKPNIYNQREESCWICAQKP
ncbi:MAG: hypothetical protein K2W92_05025 [Alphaproteobacteria bacterium]|nr:hypothetical protein [Alphaproteobacteria bacterium]